MSLIKFIGFTWTVWKLTSKRLGPVGGLIVAVIAIIGYAYIRSWLTENYPEAAKIIE